MKTFTGLAIAAGLAATATALPAVRNEKRQVYTEEYQGTPGSTVRYDKNGIPVSSAFFHAISQVGRALTVPSALLGYHQGPSRQHHHQEPHLPRFERVRLCQFELGLVQFRISRHARRTSQFETSNLTNPVPLHFQHFPALYQEYIELDLFNYGLKRFSDAEFEEAGVTADYRSIIQYMANQETGHAQLVTNVSSAFSLSPSPPCSLF